MIDRDIGKLEAQVDELRADISEIKGDLKALVAKANETQGVFRAIGWGGAGIAAAAGTVGSVISKKMGWA